MNKINDFIQNKNTLKVSPEDTVASALPKVQSSHDSAFVFDEQDLYLGLVNPYFTLIKSSNPGSEKVGRCLFHAPRVHTSYALEKVIDLFVESKIHSLPVFDDKDEFVGKIQARTILHHFIGDRRFTDSLRSFLQTKKRSIITINENENLAHALEMLQDEKISKLVMTNKTGKVTGIVTPYDLINILVSPKEKHDGTKKSGDVDTLQNDQKIKTYAKSFVQSLTQDRSVNDALKIMLNKQIGSVVILDEENMPLGIITVHDLFLLLKEVTEVSRVTYVSKNVSESSQLVVNLFIPKIEKWIDKSKNVSHAKLIVKEERHGELYEVTLELIPYKGKVMVFKKDGKELADVIHKIKLGYEE